MSHLDLFNAVKAANPSKTAQQAQAITNEIWKGFKETRNKGADFVAAVTEKINVLRQDATSARHRSSLLNYWMKSPPSASASPAATPAAPATASVAPSPSVPSASAVSNAVDEGVTALCPDSPVQQEKRRRSNPIATSSDEEDGGGLQHHVNKRAFQTPAQDKLSAKISVLETQLLAQTALRDSGIGPDGTQREIEKTKRELIQAKKDLSKKQRNAKSSQKLRNDRSAALKTMVSEKPDMAKVLHVREKVGRPLLEEDQPDLFNVIVEIASYGGAADKRRQTPVVRSVHTLKALHEELEKRDFVISQSAAYLRLVPRNSSSREGKRHRVQSVPVKLCKAQSDQRRDHPDGKFCTASIRAVEELVAILGPNQFFVLSQDDKAKVPLGITAAHKQSPILMHMEYRVSLPDHDFVVAAGHKLTPSVYAGVVVDESKIGDIKCVSYSGPTYVAVRSGKHCSSTANTHAHDFRRLLELDHFKDVIYNAHGEIKPILVLFSDGGPDECPRYPKVIGHAVQHFREHNFDAVFLITNAPGRSAYNRVERRMSHLSRELAGLLLPHDHYGSHLKGGVTADKDLERRNFQYAGETLAEVWSNLSIDGYDVEAEYVHQGAEAEVPPAQTAEWYAAHVRESQYFLQIVKCGDQDCCGQWRSNLREVAPEGFLPPPAPLRRNELGLQIPVPEDVSSKDQFLSLSMRRCIGLQPFTPSSGSPVPYDYYCPTLKNSLEGRTCPVCGLYFASAKSLEVHGRALKHQLPGQARIQGGHRGHAPPYGRPIH